jgi:hypothetical protein
MFWDKALEIASRLTHPYSIVAFGVVLLCSLGWGFLRAGRANSRTAQGVLSIAGLMTVCLLAPVIASTLQAVKGIYHIRVVALGLNGQPVSDAKLTPPPGGELKRNESGWEFDLPQQSKPADNKLAFYSTAEDGALIGRESVVLTESFFPPPVIVQLKNAPYAAVSGNVVDQSDKSIQGASVSVEGLPNVAVTDGHGYFALPTTAHEGQSVRLRAEKGRRVTESYAIAGEPAQLVLSGK